MEVERAILDTSAMIAYLQGDEKILLALSNTEELFLNPVIIGELLTGYLLGNREKAEREILHSFLKSPSVSVLDINKETSERYAVIFRSLREKGKPIPTNDLWIAATAMQHGLKIVTLDKHYLAVPQVLVEIPAK